MARSEAARSISTARTAAANSTLQAEAWLAWLVAASVAVFVTSNPFYLATACLAGLVVYESLPGGRRRRAYGLIIKIGLFFALLSIPFNVLTGSSGATGLVDLPRLSFPGWLGGVTLGGRITAEAALYAAGRALRLVALLMFAAAFNVGVDHYRLLRRVPAALRQLGVVATVAVLLLPQALAQGRQIVEAQRLRGRRMRSLRDAGAFVVPVLAGALERSIQRAESLEARGFGSASSDYVGDIRTKALVLAAAGLSATGIGLYLYEGALPALALIAAAGAAVIFALHLRGDSVETTRYSHDPLSQASILVLGSSLVSLALLLVMRAGGLGDVAYYPYPVATMPELHPLAVVAFLLLLAPVPYLTGHSFEEAGDD